MKWSRLTLCCLVFHLVTAIATGHGAEAVARTRISVWDTASTSPASITSAAFADSHQWTVIGRDQVAPTFQGDAVLSSGPITVVLRKQSAMMEAYSANADGVTLRAQFRLTSKAGDPAARLEKLALVENTRGAARVEIVYRSEKDEAIAAQLRIRRGDIAIELQPGENAGRLQLVCAGRFAILPDFFADDIVIDARRVPVPATDVPSENFLLQPIDDGNAVVMSVWENREQDVRLTLDGEADERVITGSDIAFGEGRKIWVALMAHPRVWSVANVARSQAGERSRLDWIAPFPAQWRMNFTCANQLTDSWEMLLPAEDGKGYIKPAWLGEGAHYIPPDRKRWTTVLGWFEYPCWIDHDGTARVQPLKSRVLAFDGPAVTYPINRLQATPSDTYTVVDIARGTLGVGPCQHILDLEGQKQEYRGRATCACRDALQEIYGAGQQQPRRADVEAALDDALAFVTHIRGRITQYIEFGKEMQQYLAEQKSSHPELAAFLDEMADTVGQIDSRVGNRLAAIKTPEHVADMNEDFRRTLLDYQGPDVKVRLKKYTDALTNIGGNQDELVGECRWVVRMLRQRAGIAMSLTPDCSPIAEEIRRRCQQAMLKPATYEAARH